MVNYSKLKIAILGTRGVPASYGGFETFAEEIAKELIGRGHEVTVYGRKRFFEKVSQDDYLGIKRRLTSTIYHKYLETPISSITAYLDALTQDFDLVLVCNAANSPFLWILKSFGKKVAVNVDGIERKRAKWNALGKLWYLLGEKASVYLADKIISDADMIADYYRDNYQLETEVIRYGCRPKIHPPGKVMQQFNLREKGYILYVSRMEPENNSLGVVQAYNQLKTDMPLVIVGDAPYAKEYIAKVKQTAGPNVVFTGFQFGEAYKELRSNCSFYIQATEVGGTHPALVEAMAYGNVVIANDVPEHREVLQSAGFYYSYNDFNELRDRMQYLLDHPEALAEYSRKAKDLAQQEFSWESITDKYLNLFTKMLN